MRSRNKANNNRLKVNWTFCLSPHWVLQIVKTEVVSNKVVGFFAKHSSCQWGPNVALSCGKEAPKALVWTCPEGPLSCVSKSRLFSPLWASGFNLFFPRTSLFSSVVPPTPPISPTLFILVPYSAWSLAVRSASGFDSSPQVNWRDSGTLLLVSSCPQKSDWLTTQIWHPGDGLRARLICHLGTPFILHFPAYA